MDQETTLSICALQETHLSSKDGQSLRLKELTEALQSKRTERQAGTAVLGSGKIDFEAKLIRIDFKRTFYSKQVSNVTSES